MAVHASPPHASTAAARPAWPGLGRKIISLDACVLNAGAAQHASTAQRLRALTCDDQLTVGLTPSVVAELEAPATPAAVAMAAAGLPRLALRPPCNEDDRRRRAVERRLTGRRRSTSRRRSTGRRRSGSMTADARHLVEAHMAGASYFVTADRRILDCAASIVRRLQVQPILPKDLSELLDVRNRLPDTGTVVEGAA